MLEQTVKASITNVHKLDPHNLNNLHSPGMPRGRLDLMVKGEGHSRKVDVKGSISQMDTRFCLSPAVDSSQLTCKNIHSTEIPGRE